MKFHGLVKVVAGAALVLGGLFLTDAGTKKINQSRKGVAEVVSEAKEIILEETVVAQAAPTGPRTMGGKAGNEQQ